MIEHRPFECGNHYCRYNGIHCGACPDEPGWPCEHVDARAKLREVWAALEFYGPNSDPTNNAIRICLGVMD